MFSQAIAFLRFLIRAFFSFLFFYKLPFSSPETRTRRREKSFILISEQRRGERKFSTLLLILSFSGVKKFYLFLRETRLVSLLDDYLIFFLPLRSNCWVVKMLCCVNASNSKLCVKYMTRKLSAFFFLLALNFSLPPSDFLR